MSLRFHLPEQRKLVHESVISVRWGDMDAMGHVNNTVYFRYFEMSRMDWLRSACPDYAAEGCGPVIVNAFCNFLRQVEYPAELLARHYVAHAGRSSIDTFITLERLDEPGVIQAEGGAKIVWMDFQQQKSVPLPPWLRALAV